MSACSKHTAQWSRRIAASLVAAFTGLLSSQASGQAASTYSATYCADYSFPPPQNGTTSCGSAPWLYASAVSAGEYGLLSSTATAGREIAAGTALGYTWAYWRDWLSVQHADARFVRYDFIVTGTYTPSVENFRDFWDVSSEASFLYETSEGVFAEHRYRSQDYSGGATQDPLSFSYAYALVVPVDNGWARLAYQLVTTAKVYSEDIRIPFQSLASAQISGGLSGVTVLDSDMNAVTGAVYSFRSGTRLVSRAPTAVPEPTTLVLLLTGMAALVGTAHRRRFVGAQVG